MKKRIAIITGATGGIGYEFAALLQKEGLDEIWCIARNTDKLKRLAEQFGNKTIALSLNLSEPKEILGLQASLEEKQPEIAYLINAAGIGKMGSYKDFTVEESYETVSLSCGSVVSLCTMCIPYMKSGGRIINISSQAAFQPNPFLNLYAASKVFVRNYTRALNRELRGTGITATAVCPGWVDTDMLRKEHHGVKIQFPGLVSAECVVKKAMKDAERGKDMSVYSAYVKGMHLVAKIFPQRAVMNMWVRSIEKYHDKE